MERLIRSNRRSDHTTNTTHISISYIYILHKTAYRQAVLCFMSMIIIFVLDIFLPKDPRCLLLYQPACPRMHSSEDQ